MTSCPAADGASEDEVLAEAARVLAPGGRLALDLNNRDWIARHFQPASVWQRDDDLVIDQRHLEPLTGRVVTVRTVVRDGRVRHIPFLVRLYGFTELRDHWWPRVSPRWTATATRAARWGWTAVG